MSAPLSNHQKAWLSRLSARCFRLEGARARGRGESWPEDNTTNHASYRHDHVATAVSKLGLRCCSQFDYKAVEAHFLEILGETGRAMTAHIQAQTEPERQAEAVLLAEIRKAAPAGITQAYVESICRRQFGCSIVEASTRQKWNLVYTVRNRAAARKKHSPPRHRDTEKTAA